MLIGLVTCAFVGALIYQVTKPPPPKVCGSANGPPVTSTRIRLRDGRYLAYKSRGAAKENAKYKVVLAHGFCASKDAYIPVSDNWLQDLSICLITIDRPGYAESDPNPNRSPKSDAFDIEELADQLQLGPKIYVVAISIGSYPLWGFLNYLPHRLAGAAFISPLSNFWWPSLPSDLCNKVFRKLPLLEQFRLWLFHLSPPLAWILQLLFPVVNVDVLLEKNPEAFNKSDLDCMKILSQHSTDKDKIVQQGIYESLHRDWAIACSSWEFDPLKVNNPFPDNDGAVHLWIGSEDRMINVDLQRHISKKLPWMKCHEVPYGGHLFIHDKNVCEMIFKSLVLGQDPSF